jgi:hypothetical protein
MIVIETTCPSELALEAFKNGDIAPFKAPFGQVAEN